MLAYLRKLYRDFMRYFDFLPCPKPAPRWTWHYYPAYANSSGHALWVMTAPGRLPRALLLTVAGPMPKISAN